MKCKCEHCGKMTTVPETEEDDRDEPEVEIEISGDADSIRSLLTKAFKKDSEQ